MVATHQEVLGRIDDDELKEMMLDVVNIPSLTGDEQAMGEYLARRYGELGMEVELQPVEEDRLNVLARWRGTGGGPTVMLLGHMDTAPYVPSINPYRLRRPGQPLGGMIDGIWVYGPGASNMKCCFPAYYQLAKSIRDAQVALRGDILIAAVVGEIEKAPIDQYQGKQYRGSAFGARYMVNHGIRADFCINGEPTGLRVQMGNTGYIFARFTTRGVVTHTCTKQMGVDAYKKMARVIAALEAWEPRYQARHPHPFMEVRMGIGGIQGGFPYTPSRNPMPECCLYVHVTLLPQQSVSSVEQELRELLGELERDDPALEVELLIYGANNGYEIPEDHHLVQVMDRAHAAVFGEASVRPEPGRYSVSSDCSPLFEYDIPGITYGAGGLGRGGTYCAYDPEVNEVVSLAHLRKATEVYTLATLELCGAE
ncbi:MAG: M20/M25/M40 family metallo-hydrolase [Chloroflexi bacterium]|nr:M20/M25/M40 family metallo-hydrolase [Chloroflexota bacterium]